MFEALKAFRCTQFEGLAKYLSQSLLAIGMVVSQVSLVGTAAGSWEEPDGSYRSTLAIVAFGQWMKCLNYLCLFEWSGERRYGPARGDKRKLLQPKQNTKTSKSLSLIEKGFVGAANLGGE